MDAVFDVNVLVSALITKGKSKALWLKAVAREFGLICSTEVLDESSCPW
jgi:predicted nucleic acid-binding protein